jgi:hypothetical protein
MGRVEPNRRVSVHYSVGFANGAFTRELRRSLAFPSRPLSRLCGRYARPFIWHLDPTHPPQPPVEGSAAGFADVSHQQPQCGHGWSATNSPGRLHRAQRHAASLMVAPASRIDRTGQIAVGTDRRAVPARKEGCAALLAGMAHRIVHERVAASAIPFLCIARMGAGRQAAGAHKT